MESKATEETEQRPTSCGGTIRPFISESEIHLRVRELSAEISRDYQDLDLLMVGILNGTILFMADLMRHLDFDLTVDFVGISSYGEGTTSGNLSWTKQPGYPVRGRHVLVIEDILETGQTLDNVLAALQADAPASLKSCVLLHKKRPDYSPRPPDYCGFRIEDHFVVGYGLDLAGKFRNLPYIGIYQPASADPVEVIDIEVRFWSHFKDLTGVAVTRLQLPTGCRVAEATDTILSKWPSLKAHRQSALVAVGNEYAPEDRVLSAGDTLSFFPPVQGG
jgi:hypoxanthine phosphoribosyltransferase